ncbi:Na+/H+ antiporter subunit D [Mycetocola manganoxydans]|uniref:Na+/H+ antiporter subunit D n=1 Tax=Mycetocola manganoxydans TaxID=699879 RepID=A0A3L6ZY63_9MICO|nr:Na+/H+ antiporter subunit D [Mycetocola manganoxydans]RLP72072.1 Na+/H+ antiporter subunit D [Mycetocola manganoxydans]GHD47817.1 putative cation antiporter NADH dehydrogenase subunit [Mycetocola manganoxydans]
MSAIVPLLVLLPLLGAAAALVLGAYRRAQVLVSTVTLTAVVILSSILLVHVDSEGPVVIDVGGWDAPFGIVLVADRLAVIMVLIAALMLLGVLVFATGQGIADGDRETPVSIFHPTYLVLAAGLFDAFIAGDLFNLYVGFEMLLSASYVLLTLAGTGARIRAGVTYIIVSLTSSILFLAAIAFIYGATGTVTMALVAERVRDLPADVQLILCIALLVAFCIKAAVFPMSFWLPDSYPTAPAPVTAVFAGLLTKVGVYAIIRTDTVLFTEVDIDIPLMVIALLTLVIGILGALAQADIKRLLSFTLVSHIGYMIFGIAIGSQAALAATIYYIIHHIIVQTTLFLATGLVERVGGTTSINRLGGMLRASPFVSVLFFIGAMNLGGIPPFSGFLGKVGLFDAGVTLGTPLSYVLIAAGAATSLLTLYALVRVWNMVFWRPRSDVEGYSSPLLDSLTEGPEDEGGTVKTKTVPKLMLTATAGMVALTVALTVFAGPLFDFASRTAADFESPTTYVDAVFPGGVE